MTSPDRADGAIPLDEWLRFLDGEYLSTFIRDGGASVKFAAASDEVRRNLRVALKSMCDELGYVFAELDAASIRAYMPQDIFFGIASQIDWRLLAKREILRLCAELSFRVEGIDPAAEESPLYAIADANGLDPSFVLSEIRPAIQDNVFKNQSMSRDFRVAMARLCSASVDISARGGDRSHPIVDWLTGANTRISAVRMFGIHTPINRVTARYFIESATYWVRSAGYSGTVILLDNTRVTLARNPRDGVRHYTRAMTMEHYELLREFIDGADRLSGTLLAVSTNYDFLDESSPKGYGIYQALQTRIIDDVRDRNVVNPIASLVRLSQ